LEKYTTKRILKFTVRIVDAVESRQPEFKIIEKKNKPTNVVKILSHSRLPEHIEYAVFKVILVRLRSYCLSKKLKNKKRPNY